MLYQHSVQIENHGTVIITCKSMVRVGKITQAGHPQYGQDAYKHSIEVYGPACDLTNSGLPAEYATNLPFLVDMYAPLVLSATEIEQLTAYYKRVM